MNSNTLTQYAEGEQILARSLAQKIAVAKAIYAEILNDEKSLFDSRDKMLMNAWRLGRILSELKEEIGHGKWLFWLGGNWAELGERNSQRCIAFFKANEQWEKSQSVEFHGFEIESVRKFMWGYVPAKERMQLENDEDIKPGAHHLTFVNQFTKWDRQLRSGHIESLSLEILKRETMPMLDRLGEILGFSIHYHAKS